MIFAHALPDGLLRGGRGGTQVPDAPAQLGGFEPQQVSYKRLHSFPNPTVSKDAKEGAQSAELKADKPVELTVKRTGTFDGRAVDQE